jgi:hypothetical protein
LLAACASFAGAIRWGASASGGADSYGYVSQAYGWATGRLELDQPLAARLPWPDADDSLAPLGYVPAVHGHASVPVYPPGLPLLMAIGARLDGPCGPFLVVPLGAALLVWSTFWLGRRLGAPISGALTAVLVAASPTVLFQSMSPMSDVPVSALWICALSLILRPSVAAAGLSGAVAALALLVRPNLLLIPAVMGAFLVARSLPAQNGGAWSRQASARIGAFGLPLIAAAIFIAALNRRWYGGALHSGYGPFDYFYRPANLLPNIIGYARALVRSQTPFIFLSLLTLGPGLPKRLRPRWPPGVRPLLGGFVLAVWVSYLFYLHFDEWWYLRFLLPALPVMLLLAVIAVGRIGSIAARPWSTAIPLAAFAFALSTQVSFARGQHMFGALRVLEQRYLDIGRYIDRTLPRNAIVISMQHSGTVRLYGGRLTLRYDRLDGPWLARAPRELERLGLHPYALLEDWEAPAVRSRLGLDAGSPLPWTALARMREPMGVTLYDAASAAPAVSTPVTLMGTTTRQCAEPLPPPPQLPQLPPLGGSPETPR